MVSAPTRPGPAGAPPDPSCGYPRPVRGPGRTARPAPIRSISWFSGHRRPGDTAGRLRSHRGRRRLAPLRPRRRPPPSPPPGGRPARVGPGIRRPLRGTRAGLAHLSTMKPRADPCPSTCPAHPRDWASGKANQATCGAGSFQASRVGNGAHPGARITGDNRSYRNCQIHPKTA